MDVVQQLLFDFYLKIKLITQLIIRQMATAAPLTLRCEKSSQTCGRLTVRLSKAFQ